MIEIPRRSVTRFFIPLIDVLTLMFCIFLLMPVVKATGDGPEHEAAPAEDRLAETERQELDRLRQEKLGWGDLERLRAEKRELQGQVVQLREDKVETIQ